MLLLALALAASPQFTVENKCTPTFTVVSKVASDRPFSANTKGIDALSAATRALQGRAPGSYAVGTARTTYTNVPSARLGGSTDNCPPAG